MYFGLFTDPSGDAGCKPRERAYAIQRMTGSKADLNEIGKHVTEMTKKGEKDV